jgi:hypothetical protein
MRDRKRGELRKAGTVEEELNIIDATVCMRGMEEYHEEEDVETPYSVSKVIYDEAKKMKKEEQRP